VLGRGARHREFAFASGEMNSAEFTAFLVETLGGAAAHSLDGSIHYVCMDWRHVAELIAAGSSVFTELKNVCVWVKTNAGQGSFYRSQHEFVLVFKNGTAPHLNTFRARPAWAHPHQCLDLCGREHVSGRAHGRSRHAPDRETRGAGRGRHEGLLSAQGSGARPLHGLGHDDHGGREGWAARQWHRVRPGLCRRRTPALAGLFAQGRGARGDGPDLRGGRGRKNRGFRKAERGTQGGRGTDHAGYHRRRDRREDDGWVRLCMPEGREG
jgi:hypothetical protein